MLYKCLTCSGNSVFLWRHAKDSLINVFRNRMCGQTLLFIVIANCAITKLTIWRNTLQMLLLSLSAVVYFYLVLLLFGYMW